MSLEARVQVLENKYDSLDYAFRENNKILEATHGVVSLILHDQQEMRKELHQMGNEQHSMSKKLQQMCDEQTELKQSFKRLELLVRQALPSN